MTLILLGIILGDLVFKDPKLVKESCLLAMDERNFILIGDTDNNRLILHNQDGLPIKEIGKKGYGPGDFSWITTVVFDGKHFWAHDFRKNELYKFDSNLNTLETHSIKTPINRTIHIQDPYLFVVLDNNGDKSSTPHILKLNFRDSSKSQKMFAQAPLTQNRGLHAEINDSVYFMNFDWDAKVLFANSNQYIAYCLGNSNAVYLVGKEEQKVVVKFKKSKIDRDYIKNSLAESYPPDKVDQFIKAIQFEDHWPNFVKLWYDHDLLWVIGPRQGNHFQVACLDTGGKTLGTSTVKALPLLIKNNVAYAFSTNDDDLLTLKKEPLVLQRKH